MIRNSSSGVYNYDNLEFILSDPCFPPTVQQFLLFSHQQSRISLSADFASPVSGVNMVSPANNWMANAASGNVIPVTFNGYDTSRLVSIIFQYNVPGSSTWKNGFTDAKKKLGSNSTTTDWDISSIADGAYNLRLQVKDKSGNIIYSPVVTGLIDRTPPALFGTPKPANAIYNAGTQISYSYTEDIDNALAGSAVKMRDLTVNKNIQVDLSAFGNKMIVVPSSNITTNTGHVFRVIAKNITDLYGNIKTMPDTLIFTVGKSSFSTGPDALNITAGKTSMYEDDKGSLIIHFNRNRSANAPTVIYYNIAGNAVYGKDYTVTYSADQTEVTGINGAQGALVLPKGSSSVNILIHPIADMLVMPDKKITITLSPGGGYSIGSHYSVSDTILDHNLPAPVISANKATTLCSGDSVVLSTTSKIDGKTVTYLWSTGATNRTIKVKTSGSYTVRATDDAGFTGYSAPTQVTFTCGSPVNLTSEVLSKRSALLSWDAVDCAVKYNLRHRKAGKGAWTSDTVKSNMDKLKGLKANTSYEWRVASICQYPDIIIGSYTIGGNFTTPVPLLTSRLPVHLTIQRRWQEMDLQQLSILTPHLPALM